MRMFRWLGLAALAVTVGGTAQAETVKIGVVLPFSAAPMPISAIRWTRRSISTSSCTPRTSRRNKVELIKRDEGPPTGAAGQDRRRPN